MNNEGVALERQQQWAAALAKFRQALKLNPSSAVIRSNLEKAEARRLNNEGAALSEVGDFAGALRKYMDALLLNPHDIMIRDNIAKANAELAKAPPTSDSSKPTARDYHAALETVKRLEAQQSGLRERLDNLKRWRIDSIEYRREYEAGRVDAWRGALGDILSSMQAVEAVEKIARTAKYAKYLPSGFAPRFATAFETSRAIVLTQEAKDIEEEAERDKKVQNGQVALANAVSVMEADKLRSIEKNWLGATGKLFEIAIVINAFRKEQRSDKWELQLSSAARAIGDVVGIGYPPLCLAIGAMDIGLRMTQYYFATAAINELQESIAKNWFAEHHLFIRHSKNKKTIEAAKNTISLYESHRPAVEGNRAR